MPAAVTDRPDTTTPDASTLERLFVGRDAGVPREVQYGMEWTRRRTTPADTPPAK